jgi:hypothetical protein
MATYTRDDLIRRVLFRLGVLDADEAPEASDHTLVNQGLQQKLEELYADGLIPFDVDGPIPARYFSALCGVCAVQFIDDFSAYDRTATLASGQQAGTAQLWKLREFPDLNAPTQADYF